MKSIAIVGGGVSGLTCAQLLKDRYDVTVFEKESTVGGLVRCQRVDGSLFHLCGGHVFNTRNQRVADWFWSRFDKDRDFVRANRHSAVCLDDGHFVDYPIENHIYQLPPDVQQGIVADLRKMILAPRSDCSSFGDFLLHRFGKTLYDLYFKPYNAKVWRRDLSNVPLSWLEGKLPMPTVEEILLANIRRTEERQFVHSTFYYAKRNGSQFLADSLAMNVRVETSSPVLALKRASDRWRVNGRDFDSVVFAGNVKDLPQLLEGLDLKGYAGEIARLESHGTTAVFCETDPIPYSWFYQPGRQHDSHRFICTGNFSPTNNAPGKMTCTVEFTDEIDREEVLRQLPRMPFRPRYLAQCHSRCTYPIQRRDTRDLIARLKRETGAHGLFLCGRFAEWEYFNMDAAMASAFDLCDTLAAGERRPR